MITERHGYTLFLQKLHSTIASFYQFLPLHQHQIPVNGSVTVKNGATVVLLNVDELGPRFPDASDVYTSSLRKKIIPLAEENGIALRQGVYVMYSGPNYETPAEIRMFRMMGADAVGMSTVPEAIVAAHCGMDVVGISCITNMAAGVLPQKLNHQEVVETAALVHDKFQKLLTLVIDLLDR